MKLLFVSALCIFTSLTISAQLNLGITNHNHIALQVKDIQAAAQFYREVLQLEPIAVPENLKAIRAWFKVGTYQIHLLDGRNHPINDDRNGRHLALFVKSIEDAAKYLESKGVQFHNQVRFDGVRQLYFSDLDGHLIELNQQ